MYRSDDVAARDTARRLAKEEGDFCRHLRRRDSDRGSEFAETAEKGSVILAMLPDTGERYLSTFLFEGCGGRLGRGVAGKPGLTF